MAGWADIEKDAARPPTLVIMVVGGVQWEEDDMVGGGNLAGGIVVVVCLACSRSSPSTSCKGRSQPRERLTSRSLPQALVAGGGGRQQP